MKLLLFTCTWCIYMYSFAQPSHADIARTELEYWQQGVNRAIQTHQLDSQAICLGNLGLAYQIQDDYVNALEKYARAIQIGKEIGDTTIIAGNLLNSGIIYKNQGIYDKGLENLLLASVFFEKLYRSFHNPLDEADLASCYNSIGDMYRILKQNKLALEYYQEGLLLRFKSEDMHEIAGSLNFIGEFYSDIGQYDSALFYLDSSLHIKNRLQDPDPSFIPTTLLNIGTVYLQMNEVAKAEQYFIRIVNNTDLDSTKPVKAEACFQLASLYYQQQQFHSSDIASNQSIRYARQLKLNPLLLENYALKRKIYEQLHDLAAVVHYDTLYMALKDELLDEQKNKSLIETQIRYETDKKERELIILHQEQDVEQLKVLILSLSISLLVIIITLVVRGLYREKKNRKQVQVLMKELNHRVKNNFQLLKSLLIIQKDKVTDSRIKEEIKSIENRLQSMIHIHRRLYQKDHISSVTSINIKYLIEDLVKDLKHSYGYDHGLTINMNLEVIHVNIDQAIPMGLIINEIISNSFKHAFAGIADPELIIEMRSIDTKLFSIRIRDNGKGQLTNEHVEKEASFGLKLIRILSKQLHAEVEVKSEQGVVYELTLKK